jgi:murein DD-endopeptidase MepM/ murein hydrolase activator NlpD
MVSRLHTSKHTTWLLKYDVHKITRYCTLLISVIAISACGETNDSAEISNEDKDTTTSQTTDENQGEDKTATSSATKKLLSTLPPESRPPNFKLPFKCHEEWRLTTRKNHDPENAKIDFYDPREIPLGENRGSTDFFTEGRFVYASAPGVITEIDSDIGAIEIDHGNNWFSMYVHMATTGYNYVGRYITWGEPIGTVSDVGVKGRIASAHLHYEQAYDSNPRDGKPDFLSGSPERRIPYLEGALREMKASNRPVVRSTNNCNVTYDEPEGSYKKTCSGCAIADDDFLSCLCLDVSGSQKPAYLYLPCDYDIANCNGILTCGACPSPPISQPPLCSSPSSWPSTKSYVNIWTTAIGRLGISNDCPQVGKSYTSSNPQYVWCRKWGDEVRDGNGNYNHWWLWTDLDTGGRGWISAYYIKGQGNDQADDINTGRPIPSCD